MDLYLIFKKVHYVADTRISTWGKQKIKINSIIMETLQFFKWMGVYLDSSKPEETHMRHHTCSLDEVQSNMAPRCQGCSQVSFLLSPTGSLNI